MPKKFDLDKFVEDMDQGSPESTEEMFAESRYRECPRCGSESWDKLVYSKRGRVQKCNECEDEDEQ